VACGDGLDAAQPTSRAGRHATEMNARARRNGGSLQLTPCVDDEARSR
jgi:hypothetical protein